MPGERVVSSVRPDPIMTLEEVAEYLKVSEKTVLRMVRTGQFPGVKVSNQWRFVRAIVDDWLSVRTQSRPKIGRSDGFGAEARAIPLTRLVSSRRILLNLVPGAKVDVLRQLVAPLREGGLVADTADYLRRLVAREDVVSTGIGRGFAIPHVREPAETRIAMPCIVLGVCREGTNFDALDGDLTHVFAMPCAGSETAHLHLLAKISLVFRRAEVIDAVVAAQTTNAVMDILAAADQDVMDKESWRNSPTTHTGEIRIDDV